MESNVEIINQINMMLSGTSNLRDEFQEGSIMEFGKVCNCDDNFMCEHRKNKIIEFLKTNLQWKS